VGASKRNRKATKPRKKADTVIKITATGIEVDTQAEVSVLGPPGPPSDEPHIDWLGKPTEAGKKAQEAAHTEMFENDNHGFDKLENNVLALPKPEKEVLTLKNLKSMIEEEKAKKKRTVTLIRDHTLDYPEMYLKVFVLPDPDVKDDEARFAKMFARAKCYKATSFHDADIVLFAGGSDVEASLYCPEKEPHPTVHSNSDRDDEEIGIYLQCVEEGIPMVGVCRGAQFLHVMNGGKLYQDVDGHYGNHSIFDPIERRRIDPVSSVHHQMCIQNAEMEVLGIAMGKSSTRWLNAEDKEEGKLRGDIEAFFYRETACLGFQGHPEYRGFEFYTMWCLQQIEKWILKNNDLSWVGEGKATRLRLDQDTIKFRRQIMESSIMKAAQERN
jgi:GMP synthase-like glutamine amidotransferase